MFANPLLLNAHSLIKYFGGKPILNELSFTIHHKDKIALIGENGAGKSTLAGIIAGEIAQDSGLIHKNNTTIALLNQEPSLDDFLSVNDYIEQNLSHIFSLRDEMQRLEAQMPHKQGQDLDEILQRYGELQDNYQHLGAYDIDFRIETVLHGLLLSDLDLTRNFMSLSGGEKTRVALAVLLLKKPDLLILDEPTNHLDQEGILWLESYFQNYEGAIILISHDREFMNRSVNQIWELSSLSHQLDIYHGNYDEYLVQKQSNFNKNIQNYREQLDQIEEAKRLIKQGTHNTQQKVDKSETDQHIRYAKSQSAARTKSKNIRSHQETLKRLEDERLANPNRNWRLDFSFEPHELTSMEPIQIEGLKHQFEDQILFDQIDVTLNKGDRIILSGPNGSGKSTLLRLIMSEIPLQSGKITVQPGAILAYLPQEPRLNPSLTVLEAFSPYSEGQSDKERLQTLHRNGLFTDPYLASTRLSALSVGQQRKFMLACIIAQKANVLLLDEPTNHMDPASMESLEEALINFEGAVLAVSHDRRFMNKIATNIWRIDLKTIAKQTIKTL